MPKPVEQPPASIRPLVFHGLEIPWEGRDSTSDVYADCPFCGRADKLGVSLGDGRWHCVVCDAKGNARSFLPQLWEASRAASHELEQLAQYRLLLEPSTLAAWGCRRSVITTEWLVPGYGPDGTNSAYKVVQAYVYRRARDKHVLKCTTDTEHALFGANLFDPSKPEVYVVEGVWNGMALWEVLRQTKFDPSTGIWSPTSSESASLYAKANVLAVPGCNVFREEWCRLLAGKKVHLIFDNDHPGKHPRTGQPTPPAALQGLKRVIGIFGQAEEPPEEINFLEWGAEGFNPDLDHGFDIRDWLSAADNLNGRVTLLSDILSYIQAIPDVWIQGKKPGTKKGTVEIDCMPCSDWRTVQNAWRLALKWIPGLDRALSVMLAAVASTESEGDQLWFKVVGPASCGKSNLAEALSVNKKYVLSKSTIRGFHSGFKTDKDGAKDNSLIALVNNKTLVTKDGDTLLQSPNLSQILSEARDIYDRVSRTHYRHGLSRDYEGLNMTWLLLGTSSLRSLDQSELGERFLDCVVVDDIDEELEDEVSLRVAYRSSREMAFKAGQKTNDGELTNLTLAKQLTGGYVSFLRENAQRLLDQIPEEDTTMRQCVDFGTFVAFMRARPSAHQQEKDERELAYRLVSQVVRLAKCLAVVRNRSSLDAEVMGLVREVALDTARGKTFEICQYLFQHGEKGTSVAGIAVAVSDTEDKVRGFLKFLKGIKAAEVYAPDMKGPGVRPQKRWRLTKRLTRLWRSVVIG